MTDSGWVVELIRRVYFYVFDNIFITYFVFPKDKQIMYIIRPQTQQEEETEAMVVVGMIC